MHNVQNVLRKQCLPRGTNKRWQLGFQWEEEGGGGGIFLLLFCFVKLDVNADIANSARRKQQQQQPLRPCTRFTHKERERVAQKRSISTSVSTCHWRQRVGCKHKNRGSHSLMKGREIGLPRETIAHCCCVRHSPECCKKGLSRAFVSLFTLTSTRR